MYNSWISMLAANMCKYGFNGLGDGICAVWNQMLYGLLSLICKILGLFADLLNIAFYIFGGVGLTSKGAEGLYDIEIKQTGEKSNILDYFVLSQEMQRSYLFIALIGLLAIVIFTIYKIIKQDYFDKAGPRSKGPIFRNVAISCISFLLVVPIFYLVIHISSLLAVSVMDAMGMNSSILAGAKVFRLAWNDNGAAMDTVNNILGGSVNSKYELSWMFSLHNDTLFTIFVDGNYVKYDDGIIQALNIGTWSGSLAGHRETAILSIDANHYAQGVEFYWYIYIVGVIVAIKSLYKLILAMIQRIFKLMGLFLVAPSPISQYVLDDGVKYKRWLKNTIDQGLRLVVASMSFSIFLIALDLISGVNFVSAFNNAKTGAEMQTQQNANVVASVLAFNGEVTRSSVVALESNVVVSAMESLANAFMQIVLIMGAGGAIIDLDSVLTPLIGSDLAGSSLDAGATGSAAAAPVNAAVGLATRAAGAAVGLAGAAIAGGAGLAAKGIAGAAHHAAANNEGHISELENSGNGGSEGGTENGAGPVDAGGGGPGGNPNGGGPTRTVGGGDGPAEDAEAKAPEAENPETPAESTGAGGEAAEGTGDADSAGGPEGGAGGAEGGAEETGETGSAEGAKETNGEGAPGTQTPEEGGGAQAQSGTEGGAGGAGAENGSGATTEKSASKPAAKNSPVAASVKEKRQKRLSRRKHLRRFYKVVGLTAKGIKRGFKFAKKTLGALGLGQFAREMLGIPKEMAENFSGARKAMKENVKELTQVTRRKRDANGNELNENETVSLTEALGRHLGDKRAEHTKKGADNEHRKMDKDVAEAKMDAAIDNVNDKQQEFNNAEVEYNTAASQEDQAFNDSVQADNAANVAENRASEATSEAVTAVYGKGKVSQTDRSKLEGYIKAGGGAITSDNDEANKAAVSAYNATVAQDKQITTQDLAKWKKSGGEAIANAATYTAEARTARAKSDRANANYHAAALNAAQKSANASDKLTQLSKATEYARSVSEEYGSTALATEIGMAKKPDTGTRLMTKREEKKVQKQQARIEKKAEKRVTKTQSELNERAAPTLESAGQVSYTGKQQLSTPEQVYSKVDERIGAIDSAIAAEKFAAENQNATEEETKARIAPLENERKALTPIQERATKIREGNAAKSHLRTMDRLRECGGDLDKFKSYFNPSEDDIKYVQEHATDKNGRVNNIKIYNERRKLQRTIQQSEVAESTTYQDAASASRIMGYRYTGNVPTQDTTYVAPSGGQSSSRTPSARTSTPPPAGAGSNNTTNATSAQAKQQAVKSAEQALNDGKGTIIINGDIHVDGDGLKGSLEQQLGGANGANPEGANQPRVNAPVTQGIPTPPRRRNNQESSPSSTAETEETKPVHEKMSSEERDSERRIENKVDQNLKETREVRNQLDEIKDELEDK